MTPVRFEEVLHAGELILNECEMAGIGVSISERTGRLLSKHGSGRPYFLRQLHEHEYAVKLAIAQREAQE